MEKKTEDRKQLFYADEQQSNLAVYIICNRAYIVYNMLWGARGGLVGRACDVGSAGIGSRPAHAEACSPSCSSFLSNAVMIGVVPTHRGISAVCSRPLIELYISGKANE